jgi:hypothetical protein
MHGYLHNKMADKIMQQLNVLLDLTPDDVPKASRFLLKMNFSEPSTSHLETQKLVDAALKAKALESAQGARAKQVRRKLTSKILSRTKLGIATIEQQICKDGMHRAPVQYDAFTSIIAPNYPLKGLFCSNLTQPPLWAA